MKRIIRDSVTGATNKPKNAVWVKDGQDMKWKLFKGTNQDSVDSDFLSRVSKRNNANYIDVIVVPNGTHPNEVINSSSQNEYEYRKNIYLKRKHEFETLGEDDNNDVLSREEKMRIAKAEMDKVAPKFVDSADKYDVYSSSYTPDMLNELINYYSSQDTMSYEDIWDEVVNQYHNESLADDVLDGLDELEAEDDIYSAAEYSDYKSDRRIGVTNQRYKGYMIRLDRAGYGYNVYDKNGELEDSGYPSKEAARSFIDELVSESDDEIESSVDIDEETEDPKWICLDIKHVRDSDGMLTDYALYTTEDEDKYICMFGDVDAYPPDEMYADAEFDTEEEALEWFEDYTGPGDEEDEEYEHYDILESTEAIKEGIDGILNKLGGQAAFRRELMDAVDAYPGIEDDIEELADMMYGRYKGVVSIEELESAIEYMIDYEIKERKPKNDVVESSKSLNSVANKYPEYMKVSRGGQNFSVHYNLIDNSPSADAHQMWSEFQASVSAIKPYDDAEYAWAQIENGHINVIKGGKVIQQYYYFDADDMDVENSEWCDIIIDEAIDLIAKINKDIEPRMVYNSTSIAARNKSSITSSADKTIRPIDELNDVTDQLRDDLIQKLVDVMSSPNFGFSRNEAIDYSRVDIRFDDDENRIEVEVGAEVDYDGLMQIAQDLDPIIQSYDKAAYFDAEDAGLLIAFIPYKSLRNHMKVNSASDIPEPSLDPPEYDDPEEVDEDVTVEFDMDRVRIDVDKSGSWEYIDDSFLDDVLTDDTLYSAEYDVKVRDRNGLLEDLDDILKHDIPVEAGEYRISCHITLVYHITGIEKYDEYPDDNYGDSSEYSTENAEVKFDFHDSYVEDFRIVD